MARSNDTANTPEHPAAAAFLAEARPGDALEAMIVEQMAAVHAAAMRCLARAGECTGHPEIEARYLREAARLLNLFQRQSDALDRRRIAAEDRAGARERDERLAGKDWQEDCRRARLEGQRPPPRPKRPTPAWPAWPADAGNGPANGRDAGGGRNGAAPLVSDPAGAAVN